MTSYGARVALGIVCIFCVGLAHLPLTRARLLPVSQAAAAGLGGYTAAFLSIRFGCHGLVLVLAIAVLVAGVTAFIFGLLASRLSGDRFVLATLAGQMLFLALIDNTAALGGAQGIGGLPVLSVGGFVLASPQRNLGLAIAVAVVVLFVVLKHQRSPHGPALQLVGQDDVFAAALGLSCWRERLRAFVTASALTSLVGVVQTNDIQTVAPEMFGIGNAIAYLAVGVLGRGSILGVGLAAIMYVLTPEVLKFWGLPPSGAAFVRNVVFGIAMVLVLGISHYRRDRVASSGQAVAPGLRAT